jgi:hypothetical protein
MKNAMIALMVLSVAAAVACGGGSSSDSVIHSGGGSTTVGFQPAQPAPGSNTISMESGAPAGDAVSLEVIITETEDVYGASFRVQFDPALASFLGWHHGTLLERGGHAPTYTINQVVPGEIVVGVSRNGNVPPVNATGSEPLVILDFRMTRAGTSDVSFSAAELYDGSLPPQRIPGVAWFGGTLYAN